MNKDIDIVITMGGLGSRFKKAGYTVPKYMIEAKGRTLFEWSLISLEGYRDRADKYVFIAMKDEANDVEGFIRGKCEELGIGNCLTILRTDRRRQPCLRVSTGTGSMRCSFTI